MTFAPPARVGPEIGAMTIPRKRDFPVDQVRRFLEPGPIILVSSAWKGRTNVMTLGWHLMLGFDRIGFYLWQENHSFEMIRRSRQCVINLPTLAMIDTVVDIGNCSGRDVDKFARFGLTAATAAKVDAPLIADCHANFECELADGSQVGKHGLFIWDVVKAHVAVSPKNPRTVHYRGDGQFMVSGQEISRRGRFSPDML